MKNMSELKDRAILLGWITGLLLLISVIWILSQPVQKNYILRTVNSVFINNNDSRRVSGYLPNKPGKTALMGFWYSMYNSPELFMVFTVFQDGILVPLGAVVSSDGNVQEIIPLSAHAVQVYEKMPQSILQIYIKRIETSAKIIIEG